MKIEIDRTHGGAAPPDLLDFSASVNPLGPPPRALAAYHEAAALIARYPPSYPNDLGARLSWRHRVVPDNVVVANGSTQLIHLLARMLRPHRPLVAIPTFSEIANAMIVAGSAPCAIEASRERNFAIEIEQVERALEQGADAIFIGRPNSPTGAMLVSMTRPRSRRECSSRGCCCVFDEAFIDFAGEEHSAIRLAVEDPRVIVLRSLTKIFAIPGLRLGFAVAGARRGAPLARCCRAVVGQRRRGTGRRRLPRRGRGVCRAQPGPDRRRTRHLFCCLSRSMRIHTFPSAANFLMLEWRNAT